MFFVSPSWFDLVLCKLMCKCVYVCSHVCGNTHVCIQVCVYVSSLVFGGWHSVFLSYSPTRQGHSLNPELCNSVTFSGYLVSGKPRFTFKPLESKESCYSSLCCHSDLQSSRLHSEHFTQRAVFLTWFESLCRFSSTHPFHRSTLLLTMVPFILSIIELLKLEIRTLKGHKIEICVFYLKEILIL